MRRHHRSAFEQLVLASEPHLLPIVLSPRIELFFGNAAALADERQPLLLLGLYVPAILVDLLVLDLHQLALQFLELLLVRLLLRARAARRARQAVRVSP